jgi:hypothetical protein
MKMYVLVEFHNGESLPHVLECDAVDVFSEAIILTNARGGYTVVQGDGGHWVDINETRVSYLHSVVKHATILAKAPKEFI